MTGGRAPRAGPHSRVPMTRIKPLGVGSTVAIVEAQHVEELADLVRELRRMTHAKRAVEAVAVPPAYALASNVPRLDELLDDSLRRALRDADGRGDVAKPRVRVSLDAEEHLGVARDEAPLSI